MNYFELVGIDPNAQWDQTHFEQLLQKKRAEWSIQCTGVGRKALQAKQYLGLLPDIQTVMSDPVKRLAHLTDIRQEKIAEHEKQLQRDIGWYNAQKSATRNELDKFFDAYQDIATKDQIMVQLHIVIRPSNAGTTKIPFHIETSTLNEIDDMLNVLNKTSLYDLLHLPQTADEKTLCAAARRLYEEAVQSRSEAPEKILAKHAESIFFSLEKRTQYDEILKQKELDKLCKELDGVMGRKSDPVLLPSLIEGFLQRAYAAGCSQREAYDRLFKYAAQKEWTILPDSVDKEAQKRHNEELLRDMIEKKSYFSAQKLLHKYEEDMF